MFFFISSPLITFLKQGSKFIFLNVFFFFRLLSLDFVFFLLIIVALALTAPLVIQEASKAFYLALLFEESGVRVVCKS